MLEKDPITFILLFFVFLSAFVITLPSVCSFIIFSIADILYAPDGIRIDFRIASIR